MESECSEGLNRPTESGTTTGRTGGKTAEKLDVPCHVCGDQSSGYHLGAYACEACKKFFIRSTKVDEKGEHLKYVCPKRKQCIINKTTRTHCQYCRFQKCLDVGMARKGSHGSSTKPATATFAQISCQVCGAESSGFHFGAITCEGCKGFFRRTIKERDSDRYVCPRNKNCPINCTTRNTCRYCRFRKCLTVGMSVEGSRIGRQPNHVKQQILGGNFSFMKKGTKSKVKTEFDTTVSVSEVCDVQGHTDLNKMTNPSTTTSKNLQEIIPPGPCVSIKQEHINTSTTLPPIDNIGNVVIKQEFQGEAHNNCSLQNAASNNPTEFTEPPYQPQPSGFSTKSSNFPENLVEDQKEVSHPTDSASNVGTFISVPQSSDIVEKERQSATVKHEFFMSDSNLSEFIETIVAAACELDTIRIESPSIPRLDEGSITTENLWEKMMKLFSKHVHCVLKFAKKIPGFRSFPMDDQICMVQNAVFQIVVTILAKDFNERKKTYNYFAMTEEERQKVIQLFPQFAVLSSQLQIFGKALSPLKLDSTETALLCALQLLAVDWPGLMDIQAIARLQEYICSAMEKYCSGKGEGRTGYDRFGMVLLTIPQLRRFAGIHHDCVLRIRCEMPHLEFPQLWNEIMYTDSEEPEIESSQSPN